MKRALFIAAGLLMLTAPAHADPVSVAILTAIGYTGAAGLLAPTAVLLTIAGNALVAALPLLLLTAGVAIVANVLGGNQSSRRQAQQQSSPSDRQQTVRQSTGPRVKFYGRNKIGGTLAFFESKNGILYSLVMHNQGEISEIVEYWLSDQLVTINGSGYVNEAPFAGGLIRIETKFGTDAQTAYATLTSAFSPEYTSDHRLRGLFTSLVSYHEVAADLIGDTYPQGAPGLRIVADCSLVSRPREGDFDYSNNPSDCIYDYLINPDGAGKSAVLVDLQSFKDFADLCDELVPRKGGGTVQRYRIATSYALNEQERDILPRLLQCCDGELYITAAGKIAIRGGQWIEPLVTIDATKGHIISANFRRGQGKMAAFNELTIIYTDPDQDYSEVEGQAWIDADNIALRGRVISQQAALYAVPAHAQARRLGKIISKKLNPEWIGDITTNLFGFAALGEPTINVVFPELGINQSFAVTGCKFLDDLSGAQLSISSLSADAYAWDADTEEGTAPAIPDDISTPISLDPPTSINVSVAQRIISGSIVGAYLAVTWDEPARTALGQQAQYRESPAGVWINMSVSQDDEHAESGVVNDGEAYDIQVRTVSPGGATGAWSTPQTITATADPSAPGMVTINSVTPGSGQVAFTWTLPNSANVIGARLYRNVVNTFGTATLVTVQYGSPSSARNYTNTGLVAGTYYFWVVAINGSGVQATPVATGAQVVT